MMIPFRLPLLAVILPMKEAIKLKVLLVEDAKMAQRFGALVLTDLNCIVDTADTGEEAIELVKNNAYHLIFMDLGLPGIDGIQATQKIKSLTQKKSNPPVVALTSNTDENYKTACCDAGMSEFLVKPLNHQSAKDCLQKFGISLVETSSLS